MAGKPHGRSWVDVQIALMSIALLSTLVLWNLFAGPDRVKAENNTAAAQATDAPLDATPYAAITPTLPQVVILFNSDQPTPTPGPATSSPAPVKRKGGGGGGGTGGS